MKMLLMGALALGTAGAVYAASTIHKADTKVIESPKTGTAKMDNTQSKTDVKTPAVLNFTMNSLEGKPVDLGRYAGKVVLIVNTASKCGFTPQYKGLQALNEKYKAQGLEILGFPANDFGQQEPGTAAEIGTFCEKNYGVTFDMFDKVAVTGDNKTPLYKFLTEKDTNPKYSGEIGWNFEKFLIGRDGEILSRFKSAITPQSEEMTTAIEAALKAQ